MTTRLEEASNAPLVRHSVPPSLAGLVQEISCYDTDGRSGAGSREVASFVVPVIFSFADPFRIAFDRSPGRNEQIGSFVSGLHPGYVDITYGGPVSCLQIDLTPIGAGLFFQRPMSELTTRLVPIANLQEPGLDDLYDRLGTADTRVERLKIVVAFLERRLLGQAIDPETAFVWAAIQRSRGALRIDRLTEDLGWSRKRLAAHARKAFGLAPKRLARIARFHHAVKLSSRVPRPDWAGIAVDCGYADQAHLVRDFGIFAGAPPERWRAMGNEAQSKQTFNTTGGEYG